MVRTTRALVADDNRIVREALRRQLADWGIDAVLASGGEEAWRLLQESSAPRIAILDWSMPGTDGLELCRRVRAAASDHYSYLILLTANDGEEAIAAGFTAGADDYLVKGWPAHLLRTRLTVAERIIGVQEELLRVRASLQHLARIDSLTGLLNRRAGEEALDRELRRAARGGPAFGLVLLDADHFKAVNDTLGHATGDRVLVDTAEILRTALRSEDVLVRWGGEEFLILLPGVGLEGAVAAAERARVAIESYAPELGGGLPPVTASFGVAAAPTGGRPLRDLLDAADAALYAAKARGRNCVVAETAIGDPAALPLHRQTLAVALAFPGELPAF